MEHTKHIIRAVLLLVVIAVLFVVVRDLAVPETFGMYGHYRFGSVAEYVAQIPYHGGSASCTECHDEEAEAQADGKHGTVPCASCHAPQGTHIQNDEVVAPMLVDRSYRLCATCHQYLLARPKSFPQVVLPNHVVELGGEMSEAICLECHDAHNPSE